MTWMVKEQVGSQGHVREHLVFAADHWMHQIVHHQIVLERAMMWRLSSLVATRTVPSLGTGLSQIAMSDLHGVHHYAHLHFHFGYPVVIR